MRLSSRIEERLRQLETLEREREAAEAEGPPNLDRMTPDELRAYLREMVEDRIIGFDPATGNPMMLSLMSGEWWDHTIACLWRLRAVLDEDQLIGVSLGTKQLQTLAAAIDAGELSLGANFGHHHTNRFSLDPSRIWDLVQLWARQTGERVTTTAEMRELLGHLLAEGVPVGEWATLMLKPQP